ncbi:MAG: chitobiase/beta-hexosaminidase C-terminal domain-containing protein [Treponema sp.]|jgi:hypothetical protein|nr:chitobiase/beta-hexosaminidase C-terminal domain-containing protein [Treponema sp.]
MRKRYCVGLTGLILLVSLFTAGCPQPVSDNPSGTPNGSPSWPSVEEINKSASSRYETVPYSNENPPEGVIPNLIYSAYDDSNYYYLFLLGHIKNVPLAYRQAIWYNGTTPITIGYSSADVTEESITKSVEQAEEHSVTDTMSHTWGVTVDTEYSVGVLGGSIGLSAGGEYGREEMNSRSFSSTLETAQSKSSETSDEMSVTIGDHDEPAGLYRYSLFTTTDVYYVVITDREKNVKQAYTALCARGLTYWGIDYESDTAGSFGKTGTGELLEIPDGTSLELPTPESNDIQPIPDQKAATPTADKADGTYPSEITVTLSTTTKDAVIYYTTNGTMPSVKDSIRYENPIKINQKETTLKAIAVSAQLENSEVMTRTYTLTDIKLQTEWLVEIKGSHNDHEIDDDDDYYFENLSISNHATGFENFEKEKLKAKGFTMIRITGRFDARPIDNCWIYITIIGGTSLNGPEWYKREVDGDYSGWDYWNIGPKDISIDAFTPEFVLKFSASGASSDRWMLGERSVKFTAINPLNP